MQKENNETIKIYTMAEVASFLTVSYSKVVRLAKSGEIKSYKIGGRRLFKEGDVLEFLEKRVDRGYVFGEEK